MFDFDGSSAALTYSTVGSGQTVNMSFDAAFTMSVWITVDTYSQYRRLLHVNDSGNGIMVVYPTNANTLGAHVGNFISGWGEPSGYPTKYVACSNGSRYHLWLTRGATPAFRLWVNNAEASSTDGATGYNSGTANSILNLGRRSDAAQYADCKVGELALWNAEITDATTIQSVYYGEHPTKVRPDAQKLYLPLKTDKNPVIIGGANPTIGTVGSPALSTAHPNVIQLARHRLYRARTAANLTFEPGVGARASNPMLASVGRMMNR